jgi:hypothetical protein
MSKDKMPLDDLTRILMAPDYIFGKTPHGVGAPMAMMYKTGTLKSRPQSWKDMYLPETQKLAEIRRGRPSVLRVTPCTTWRSETWAGIEALSGQLEPAGDPQRLMQ